MTDNTLSSESDTFSTPMMAQYAQIKKRYPDTLLFFRLGDFYELFLEDAEIGSKVLDITLTARNKGKDGKIPMCGVPFHAVDAYLAKIVKAGYRAAICEQISEPGKGPEIVEREVVRIVTPGTITDESALEKKANNVVATFFATAKNVAIAYADVSTGMFRVYRRKRTGENDEDVIRELVRLQPKEIVLPRDTYSNSALLRQLKQAIETNVFPYLEARVKNTVDAENILRGFFDVPTLSVFSISEKDEEVLRAAAFLLEYLQYIEKDALSHIHSISHTSDQEYMRVDTETYNNLEVFAPSGRSHKNISLFSVIDQTRTAMGGRLLRQWLMYPLIHTEEITSRLDAVEQFTRDNTARAHIRTALEHILDIERLLAKVGVKTANARDVLALADSCKRSEEVLKHIREEKNLGKILVACSQQEESSKEIASKVEKTIKPDAPLTIREGGLIQDGVDTELDDIKRGISESTEYIAQLEGREREKTGISTLKVGYTSVFGYYIEVTKAQTKSVPEHYVRKQTLVNAERYITQELKEEENIVLTAQEKINAIEYRIFQNLLEEIAQYARPIQDLAQEIAHIDCYSSLAELAVTRNYHRPRIFDAEHFDTTIMEGRHPVVESVLSAGAFTPNDTLLDKKGFVHVITGPNMAGKSTYIRQIALIQLLAQIGSFVPAKEAAISLVDGIYTRIGAGDALAQGLSTFMVEMIETAKILHSATNHSLIILDEVGRGTSTLDGLCIARAVTEYIHSTIGAKTLFATHFHELTQLDQRLKHLVNYHVLVNESGDTIQFLHKVEKGGTDKSYGIEVAKLAGIPQDVITRARELLEKATTDQLKFDL